SRYSLTLGNELSANNHSRSPRSSECLRARVKANTLLFPVPLISKSGLLGTGQFGFGPEEVRHATVQVSKPCSVFAHLICPVFKSIARAVSKKSSGAVQFAVAVAFWQAITVAGTV